MPEIATGTAPAPAPATPASSPPPVTTAAPVSSPARDIADAFSQLDRLAGEEAPDPTPAAPPKDPPAAPKLPKGQQPQQANDNRPATEEPEEPADNEPEKPADTKPAKKGSFREHYEKLKADYERTQAELSDWKKKAEAPREDPELPKMKETLAQREKRLAELEEEIRFSAFERSDDYKSRYEKPFLDAYQAGRSKAASLKVTNPDTGESRQGTHADFDAIMRMTDDDAAAEAAASLFGNKSAVVMYHRERVQELNNARVNAVEEYRKTGGEREQARSEARKQAEAALAQSFNAEVKAGLEKYPKWFKAIDGDAQSAEILAAGMALADIAFGQPQKDAEGRVVKRSPAELVKLHAAMRNKAGAFDHVVYLLAKERKALKEAMTKLKQYEASEPGGGTGGRVPRKPANTWDEVDAKLTALAR